MNTNSENMPNCFQIINNPVSGVPSVSTKKQGARHSLKRLCGVALRGSVPTVSALRTRVRAYRKINPIYNHLSLSRVYIGSAQSAHPVQAAYLKDSLPTQIFFMPTRSAQTLNLVMKNKVVCGPDNAKAFNAALRDHAPEFHALAKELYASGMITGLAGATLETAPFGTDSANSTYQSASEAKFCRNCGHWQADKAGDGTGIGQCAVDGYKTRLYWPNQDACRQFKSGETQ